MHFKTIVCVLSLIASAFRGINHNIIEYLKERYSQHDIKLSGFTESYKIFCEYYKIVLMALELQDPSLSVSQI